MEAKQLQAIVQCLPRFILNVMDWSNMNYYIAEQRVWPEMSHMMGAFNLCVFNRVCDCGHVIMKYNCHGLCFTWVIPEHAKSCVTACERHVFWRRNTIQAEWQDRRRKPCIFPVLPIKIPPTNFRLHRL